MGSRSPAGRRKLDGYGVGGLLWTASPDSAAGRGAASVCRSLRTLPCGERPGTEAGTSEYPGGAEKAAAAERGQGFRYRREKPCAHRQREDADLLRAIYRGPDERAAGLFA